MHAYKGMFVHICIYLCVYNVCVHLTEIKCLFGVLICFFHISMLERMCFQSCVQKDFVPSWTYNWGKWVGLRKLLASWDQVLLTPEGTTFYQWNMNSMQLCHIPGYSAHIPILSKEAVHAMGIGTVFQKSGKCYEVYIVKRKTTQVNLGKIWKSVWSSRFI